MSIVVGAISLYFILSSRGDEIFNENSQWGDEIVLFPRD
jgi:hypothetical protein